MLEVLSYLSVILLIGVVMIGWALALVGLPGTWLMLLAAAGYAWLGPESGVTQITWATVTAILVMCAFGELAEFLAGTWGAKRAGGSRRAAVFALLGSVTGAIVGATLGVPIPVVGPPIAAVMGGALGALVGAALAERSHGEATRKSWQVGQAAFWGRLMGTGIKTIVATVIAVVIVVALVL